MGSTFCRQSENEEYISKRNNAQTEITEAEKMSIKGMPVNPLYKERSELNFPQKLATVAVAQFAAVGFNLEGTLTKLEAIVKEASKKGVQLLVFPEAFLCGWPHSGDAETVFGKWSLASRKIFQLWHDSAVDLAPGSEALERLCKAARTNNVFLVVCLIEKERHDLYCTMVYIKEDGTFLGKHRKTTGTVWERLFWTTGDGSTFDVYDSPVGKVGGLACWENYMPLARTALYNKDIEIYCAPTADFTPNWEATMRHIAIEGRCFVLGCNQFTRRKDFPPDSEFPSAISDKDGDTIVCCGGSIIVSPMGEVLAGPNREGEALLIAQIDLNDVTRAKWDMNVVGHYSRPDIFTLHVNEKPMTGFVTEGVEKIKLVDEGVKECEENAKKQNGEANGQINKK